MEDLLEQIDSALDRGLEIKINFGNKKRDDLTLDNIEGIIEESIQRKSDRFGKSITTLEKLKEKLKENLKYVPPIHTKLILIDNAVLIIGSNNWLSNKNNEKDEISLITTDPGSIKYINDSYIKQKGENL